MPERRFRISRRLTVLRSRALSARREFYLLWAWPFHPSALVFVRQRGFLFSLWLTPCTTNCSSTLKKGASRSKRLPNDRPRSLFGRSPDPLILFGQRSRRCFSSLRPGVFSPFPTNLFRLSPPPLFFQPRAFAVCFPAFSMPELSAVCVAAPPYPSAPCRLPAPPDTQHCCFTRPRSVRLPGRSLAPLPGCLHPQYFVFRTTAPCDPFRPRAGFHVKQTRTPRCSISSTASRVNSRPRPLPGCPFHPSDLNDYLARTLPSARRYPC